MNNTKQTEYWVTNGEFVEQGHRKGYPKLWGMSTRSGNSGKPYKRLETAIRKAAKWNRARANKGVQNAKPYYAARFQNGNLVKAE